MLNLKVGMFLVAFLPQFIDPARGPAGLQTLSLGLLLPTPRLSLQLAQQSLRSHQVVVENPSGDAK